MASASPVTTHVEKPSGDIRMSGTCLKGKVAVFLGGWVKK